MDSNNQTIKKIFLVNYLITSNSFFCVNRIGHILVFLAVALYIGLTAKRGRNYLSLIGVFTLILLGTLGI